MHPQLISIKNLEESKLQYRDIPQEDVEKLADLIELDGEVLQPLLVRKAGADTYEILAGHKRYRACKYLSEVRKLEQFSMIPWQTITQVYMMHLLQQQKRMVWRL